MSRIEVYSGLIYRTSEITAIPRMPQNTHIPISLKMYLISSSNTVLERPP